VTRLLARIRNCFRGEGLAWNVLSILLIVVGVVLLVGGLFLMFEDLNSTQAGKGLPVQSVASIMSMIPGIPFYIGDLTQSGANVIGLVSWIVGLDLLLIGLGLWARHRLAWLASLLVFTLAAYFNFVQFLLYGIIGAPVSVVEMSIDVFLLYVLLTRART